MQEYDSISYQRGKLDTLFDMIINEPDMDKAIKLARSMRGHMAVVLKILHKVRREEKRLKKYESRQHTQTVEDGGKGETAPIQPPSPQEG